MKKPSGVRDEESGWERRVDTRVIEDLAQITAKYDLSEIEIGVGDLRVRLARQRVEAGEPPPREATSQNLTLVSPAPPSGNGSSELAGTVKSPMVGTAYLRPSPEAKPFVEVGSTVKVGDKLLLVEAMKTFNEIVAPRAGTIAEILITDGSPVEYDQPLMVID